MKHVLGIETSCDETSVAIVREDKKILTNLVYSQIKEHSDYGGVVPEIAARSHMDHLEKLVEEALITTKLNLSSLDLIAVTSGPGLIGGLIVGVMMAKALSHATSVPLIGINHLEGHALIPRITNNVNFPYLLVLISGGHCQLLIVKNVSSYDLLGSTRDDAVGEAFDKLAKMLNLGYPGGPIVEKYALKGDENRFMLPRPLCQSKNCDFSFSGLKTSLRNIIIEHKDKCDMQFKYDLCASFQKTVSDILQKKITNALEFYQGKYGAEKVQIVISGGVAANRYIKHSLEDSFRNQNCEIHYPPLKLCTDNGAMIAWAGMEKLLVNHKYSDLNLEPKARWPLDSL